MSTKKSNNLKEVVLLTALSTIEAAHKLSVSSKAMMKVFKLTDRNIKQDIFAQRKALDCRKNKWLGYKKRSFKKRLERASKEDILTIMISVRITLFGNDSKLIALKDDFEKLNLFIDQLPAE